MNGIAGSRHARTPHLCARAIQSKLPRVSQCPVPRPLSSILCGALAAALAAGACREPQEEGPLRPRADAGSEDSRPRKAASCAELTCSLPATCELDDDGASCVCPQGYSGDPQNCEDVDECTIPGGNDCDENSSCVNEPGAYSCSCKEGYYRSGKSCIPLSNCQGASNVCHANATCEQVPEGVRCACLTPFYEGDGYVCRDVDECQSGSTDCADNARCRNRRSGYECECDPGFEGNGKQACRSACDVARGDPTRCDPRGHANCVVDPASAAGSCTSCLPEYLGDGKNCSSSSECAALGCGANTRCQGPVGARQCACADGFEGDPLAGCTDIDECQGGSDGCDAESSECVNVSGGYVCACKPGFERVDGRCVNVDECARGIDLCDPAADCIDESPGYDCACRAGYRGDGRACVDIDECAEGGDDCVKDGTASCQNTRGGYECVCPKGYTGDPRSEACYCDLSGVWGARQDATLVIPERSVGDVVLIAGSTTRASIWELNRFRYDGEKILIEHQPCGSDVTPEIFSPHYGEIYSSAVPNMVYDTLGLMMGGSVPMSKANALPSSVFTTPRDATLQGITLRDPLNDPWPERSADVPEDAWVDSDRDGEPGISLWPGQTTEPTHRDPNQTYSYLPVPEAGSALIETRIGCVSTALRAIGYLQGRIDSCSRLSGKVISEKTEGRVHSCMVLRAADWDSYDVTCSAKDWNNARRCTQDQVKFLDEQDQTTQAGADFELVKLGDVDATDIDCAAVRSALPALPRQ